MSWVSFRGDREESLAGMPGGEAPSLPLSCQGWLSRGSQSRTWQGSVATQLRATEQVVTAWKPSLCIQMGKEKSTEMLMVTFKKSIKLETI